MWTLERDGRQLIRFWAIANRLYPRSWEFWAVPAAQNHQGLSGVEVVMAEARATDAEWDSLDRVARRGRMREQMLASVSGASWLRSASSAKRRSRSTRRRGMTQTRLAEAAGVLQARISQIDNGEVTNLETLRAYVVGLGERMDIVTRIGNIHINVDRHVGQAGVGRATRRRAGPSAFAVRAGG